MITKEFIIEYLKDYYEKHKKIPLSTDKNNPFNGKTVSNKFGSWNNALISANIPLKYNKAKDVECKNCGKKFRKHVNQIKKSKNDFCTRNCNAIYYNNILDRSHSDEAKNKIRLALQKSRKCSMCDELIYGGQRKTCSENCLKKSNIENGKKGGAKGGIASAVSQQRRSKNEIAFAEMCIKYFGEEDILCNEAIFIDKNKNKWDSDIYIKSLKLAVLWDGHYFHFSEHASKKQKARDALKRKIILDNGCEYYTIIDYGKYNRQFVEDQFNLFIHKLKITISE